MSETNAPGGAPEHLTDGADEEVVPDYSRVGFRQLQALCKDRGIPGDGNSIALIEKLKAYDVQHGRDIDLSAAEEVDLLTLDDEPDDTPDTTPVTSAHPESPVGDGEAASASSPTGAPTAGEDVIGVGTTQPAGVITNLPAGSAVTSAAPAVVVHADPAVPTGTPWGTTSTGRVDLTVRNGVVKVGEGYGATEVRAFRREYTHGPREFTDRDHFRYIEDTHAAAHAAGHATKGGVTIGQRVGEGVDERGQRTVVYQVPLKRQG